MATIINVQHISKKYTIRHNLQADKDTLRDAIAHGLGSLARKLLFARGGQVSSTTPESEDFWALRDVSFNVETGDRLGIIGHNGAGKSTLLKILSRITEPTAGQVRITGRVASLLEVGTGFHPELTGRENIYLNGAILGMGRHEIRRRFDEIVAFAEVERFLDTPVKRYSSGMYVRLAFAVAAHLEPEILIVDEVLAVGDAAFQKKCLGKMEEAGSEGRTILFVSHNVSAVNKLCTRSIVLKNGEIVCDGTTSDALTAYSSSHLNKQYMVNGSFLFHSRVNSYGTNLIVQSMILRNNDYVTTTTVPMGGDLVMEFIVENLSQHRDADLGIIIKNSANQWVTSLNTAMVKPLINSERSFRELVTLELSNLRLTPGIYDIDITVARQGFGRLDYVENAGYFEVLEADVYGTGYNVTSYFGTFYSIGAWRISSVITQDNI